MKNAKILLAAITVLGIAGGALAFKAKGQTHTWYYNAPSGKCTSFANTFPSTIDPNQVQTYPTYSTTSNAAVACIGVFLTDAPL